MKQKAMQNTICTALYKQIDLFGFILYSFYGIPPQPQCLYGKYQD